MVMEMQFSNSNNVIGANSRLPLQATHTFIDEENYKVKREIAYPIILGTRK